MSPCPSAAELEKLGSGVLSGPHAAALRDHLGTCPACSSRLAGLDGTLELPPRPPADADATLLADVRSRPAASLQGAEVNFPTIEGYEILGVLGRGGMGVVYRAVQKALKRTVALKVLPTVIGANEAAVSRFRREATSAARLHHTNIIPVYDFGESRHASYYAMELIEGESLVEVTQRQANAYAAAPPSRAVSAARRSITSSPGGTASTATTQTSRAASARSTASLSGGGLGSRS